MKTVSRPVLLAAAFFAGFAGWSVWCFGGVREGIQFLRGERIVVDRPTVNLKQIEVGQTATAEFELRNLSGRSVEIHGAQTECDCVAAHGFPLTIGTRARRSVQLSITADRGGPITQRATLLMNIDHPPVVLIVQGHVLPSSGRLDAEYGN